MNRNISFQFGRNNFMAEKAQDQEFLEILVKAIVATPGDVKVERTIDERGVLLTLSINPADMGYIIGRRGQTAQAIRTLLKIVGAKNNARVNLKINEPEGSQRRERRDDRDDRGHRDQDIDTSSVDDLKI
jgi:uncharacterized protein